MLLSKYLALSVQCVPKTEKASLCLGGTGGINILIEASGFLIIKINSIPDKIKNSSLLRLYKEAASGNQQRLLFAFLKNYEITLNRRKQNTLRFVSPYPFQLVCQLFSGFHVRVIFGKETK